MEDVDNTARDKIQSTLCAAWITYIALMMVPPATFAIAAFIQMNRTAPSRNPDGVTTWLWLILAYLAIGFPAALFIRRHLCIAYSRGGTVAPKKYFWGMLTVWLSLELGIFLAIVGFCATGVFMPIIPLALIPQLFMMTLWPTGDMLVSHSGDSDDAEIFETPR
jgi:hypothetical protein